MAIWAGLDSTAGRGQSDPGILLWSLQVFFPQCHSHAVDQEGRGA